MAPRPWLLVLRLASWLRLLLRFLLRICYICMASLLALGRHQIRRLYEIQGSGMEDFWASALLYPQSLAQMMRQVSEKPVRRGYSRTPKDGSN